MANSDTQVVEDIKTARDAVLVAIAAGELTVEYSIRGRMVRKADPIDALNKLQDLLDVYERRANRGTTSPFRLASMQTPRRAS